MANYTVAIKQTATTDVIDLSEAYGLIPTERPVIAPPSPKVKFEEIPGGSGSLDLSQVLTNEISYSDRSGSIEFMLVPESLRGGERIYWEDVYSDLLKFLSAGRVRLWTSRNAWGVPVFNDYYYEGRMILNEWKTDKSWEHVTLDYRFDPFKYANEEYDSGIKVVADGGSYTINISNLERITVPTIYVSKPMEVTYNTRTYLLPAGSSRIIALTNMGANTNALVFNNNQSSGQGTMHVGYRRMFL